MSEAYSLNFLIDMNDNHRNEQTTVETTMARSNQSACKSTTVEVPCKQLALPNISKYKSLTWDSTDSESEVLYFEKTDSEDNYSDSEDEIEVVKTGPLISLFEEMSQREI